MNSTNAVSTTAEEKNNTVILSACANGITL
jgi:hypothetical protein